MDDDFEPALRQGLATLAREAVPDVPAAIALLPPMRSAATRRERRLGPRLLAAGVTIAVATASVVVALSLHSGSHTPPVQPSPVWTKVARSPLTPRSSQAAVFTGHDVIVWGGRSDVSTNVAVAGSPGPPRYSLGGGAAYDVGTDRWRVLPRAPIAGRYDAVAVWTGREMLVVGGTRDHAGSGGGDGSLGGGAAYDPAHRRWRRIADAPGCPRFGAWNGTQLVVGGYCANRANGNEEFFAAYDPARDRWTRLPVLASARQLVAAGGRLYAWDGGVDGRGAVFDSSTRRWRAIPKVTNGLLEDSLALVYEDRLVVIGRQRGRNDAGPDDAVFAVFDPRRRAWRWDASPIGPPLGSTVAATAPGAVVWSGFGLSSVSTDAAVRNVALENVGDAPIDLQTSGQSIVGIGYRRFFVWGGRLAGTETDPTNRPTADGAILQLP